MDELNPWAVGNIEEFHYYCCPECDERNHSKECFIQHALEKHPNSRYEFTQFYVFHEKFGIRLLILKPFFFQND